jgi:uncharacterized protein (TIGR00661 family)
MFSADKNNEKPTLLISPLDWGMGHTTRVFPIIRKAEQEGYKIIIACNSAQKKILQEEFSEVMYEEISGYDIRYGNSGTATILKILLQIPKILIAIKKEFRWVKKFLKKHKVDLIVSDNRYGFRAEHIRSVLITHQLSPKSGLGKAADRFMQNFLYRYINRFQECLVPDYENGNDLAGKLSHPENLPAIPVKYFGPLSRLEGVTAKTLSHTGFEKFILVIVSGPEPQRSLFENKIIHDIHNAPLPVILLRGKPGENNIPLHDDTKIKILPHVSACEMVYLISQASMVISRPGYSTIMDLNVLGREAVFVPTPGQGEQLYLAKYHHEQYGTPYLTQEEFSFEKISGYLKAAGV